MIAPMRRDNVERSYRSGWATSAEPRSLRAFPRRVSGGVALNSARARLDGSALNHLRAYTPAETDAIAFISLPGTSGPTRSTPTVVADLA